MITIHQDIEQGTKAWHDLRAPLVTGSIAHKLLKYGSVEKAITKQTDFKGTFAMKRGHTLEPQALEIYTAVTQTEVFTTGFVTNSKYPNAGYSPDGLSDDRVIEIKCFNKERHTDIVNGNIPFEILAQIHFGMLICEKKFAHLVIYNPDLEAQDAFKIINIKHNPAISNNFKRILNT